MRKKILFVSKDDEIENLIDKIGKDNIKIVSLAENGYSPSTTNIEFESIYQDIDSLDLDSVVKKTLSVMKKISCIKHQGKTLKELLAFKNISTWWFLRTDLYNTIYKNAVIIELIRYVITKETPSEVAVSKSNSFLDMIKDITTAEGCKITIINAHSKSYHSPTTHNHLVLAKLVLLSTTRAAVGIFRYFRLKKGAKYLIVTRSHEWQEIRTKQGDIKGDMHFWNVLKQIERSKERYLLIDLPKSYDAAKIALKEKKFPYIFWEAFMAINLLNLESFRELKNFRKRLNDTYNSTITQIKNNLKYDGTEISKYIMPKMHQYFFSNISSFYSAARNISIVEKVLSKFSIKLTVTTEENSACRAFTAASLQGGVKTLGVQHGSIGSNTISYRYNKDEVSKALSPDFVPLCDTTAVYGEYYKKTLAKKCNYLFSKICVTGQPRADSVNFYNKRRQ
jgi:hypothetical protein